MRLWDLQTSRQAVVFGAVVAAMTVAAPVKAQRWHSLDHSNRLDASIDLDSVQWEGKTVRYQLELKTLQAGSTFKRSRTTSAIDCEKNRRKGLAVERFGADGSSKKYALDYDWRTIIPGSLIEKVHDFLCPAGS